MSWTRGLLLVAAVLAAACSRKVPIDSRPCPCAEGFGCCQQVCLPLPLPDRCLADGGGSGFDGAPAGADAMTTAPGAVDGASPAPITCEPPADDCGVPGLGSCGGPRCQIATTSDPEHCGACRRSCRGGQCKESECQPVLATGDASVDGDRSFAVDSVRLYWATVDGKIKSRAHGTDEDVVLADGGEGNVRYMVLDEQFIYILTEGGACPAGRWCLRRLSQIPGAFPPTTLTDLLEVSGGFLRQGGFLYWIDIHGTLFRIAIRGAGTPRAEERADGFGRAFGLAADEQYLYWGGYREPAKEPTIYRMRLDGPPASFEPLVRVMEADSIAVDATHIYWSEWMMGLIRKAPKQPGGIPVTVASEQYNVDQIAVDDSAIYWRAMGDQKDVEKVSRCGGAIKEIGHAETPGKLITAEGSVWWNDERVGIFRVAR